MVYGDKNKTVFIIIFYKQLFRNSHVNAKVEVKYNIVVFHQWCRCVEISSV